MVKFGKTTRELLIKEITKEFKTEGGVIFSNFRNLNVEKISQLRRTLKSSSTRFKVVKNSMAKRALDKVGLKQLSEFTTEMCAVSLIAPDNIDAIRQLVNFSKENEAFKISGGFIEGQVLSLEKIKELASLPAKPELLSIALMRMKSPVYGFVNTLSGVMRGLVNVIEQLKLKKE